MRCQCQYNTGSHKTWRCLHGQTHLARRIFLCLNEGASHFLEFRVLVIVASDNSAANFIIPLMVWFPQQALTGVSYVLVVLWGPHTKTQSCLMAKEPPTAGPGERRGLCHFCWELGRSSGELEGRASCRPASLGTRSRALNTGSPWQSRSRAWGQQLSSLADSHSHFGRTTIVNISTE